MTTLTDIAWAGGLYEGEGSVSIAGSRCAHLTISMTDLDVIEKVYEIMELGYLRGPYTSNGPGRKPYWRWSVNRRDDVLKAMEILEPWLGERRRGQFEEVRQALAKRKPQGRYVTKLKDGRWRAYLPKEDGKYRSLGICATEDEALARVASEVARVAANQTDSP